jgi:hypothetical protein
MEHRSLRFVRHAGKIVLVAGAVWALQVANEPEAATAAAAFNVSVSLSDIQTTGCLNRTQVKAANALVTVTCENGQFVSISAVAVVPGSSFISPLLAGQVNSLMDGSRATTLSPTPAGNVATASTTALRRQTGTVMASKASPVAITTAATGAGTITSMRLSNATTELTPVDLVVTF